MSVVRREPYFLASTPPKPSPSPKGLYFRYSANFFGFLCGQCMRHLLSV